MITVFYTSFEGKFTDAEWRNKLGELPEKLGREIFRFHRWQDRQSRLLGKLLLREGLKKAGCGPGCLDGLAEDRNGRPFVGENVDFNISHSHEYTVCAVSNQGKVGIDIEKTEPTALEDFEKQMTPEEWRIIKSSDRAFERFYSYWTMKESVLKADGRGLSVPFDKVEISGNRARLSDTVWHLCELDICSGYVCHMATDWDCSETGVDLKRLDFQAV